MLIFDGDGSSPRKTICLSATNYGPTDITLHTHTAKPRQGFLCFGRNRNLALVNPIDHPDSNRPTGYFARGFLPNKLAVGEGVSVYFAADAPKQWIETGDLFYFGFVDTFGRYHWCPRANAKEFRKGVIETFGAVEPKPGWLERLKTPARQFRTKAAVRMAAAMPPIMRRLRRPPGE